MVILFADECSVKCRPMHTCRYAQIISEVGIISFSIQGKIKAKTSRVFINLDLWAHFYLLLYTGLEHVRTFFSFCKESGFSNPWHYKKRCEFLSIGFTICRFFMTFSSSRVINKNILYKKLLIICSNRHTENCHLTYLFFQKD